MAEIRKTYGAEVSVMSERAQDLTEVIQTLVDFFISQTPAAEKPEHSLNECASALMIAFVKSQRAAGMPKEAQISYAALCIASFNFTLDYMQNEEGDAAPAPEGSS